MNRHSAVEMMEKRQKGMALAHLRQGHLFALAALVLMALPTSPDIRAQEADARAADLSAEPGLIESQGWEGGELRIFDNGTLPPFRMLVGDQGGWQVPVEGNASGSNAGAVAVTTVDFQGEADARRVEWSGKGEGQFYFLSAQPFDMRPLLQRQAALSFLLRVDKAPKRKVTLRMGCGYPCASNADFTGLLRALPAGTWARVSVDLQCFAREGLEPEHVDVPFLLLSTGQLTITLADIKIIPDAADRATISCQPKGSRP